MWIKVICYHSYFLLVKFSYYEKIIDALDTVFSFNQIKLGSFRIRVQRTDPFVSYQIVLESLDRLAHNVHVNGILAIPIFSSNPMQIKWEIELSLIALWSYELYKMSLLFHDLHWNCTWNSK